MEDTELMYYNALQQNTRRITVYYGRTLKEAWEKFEHNLKTKELIYEYKCPHCGYVNERKGARALVVCDKCGKSFYTW